MLQPWSRAKLATLPMQHAGASYIIYKKHLCYFDTVCSLRTQLAQLHIAAWALIGALIGVSTPAPPSSAALSSQQFQWQWAAAHFSSLFSLWKTVLGQSNDKDAVVVEYFDERL